MGGESGQEDQGSYTGSVSLGNQLIYRMSHEGGVLHVSVLVLAQTWASLSLGVCGEERSLTKVW